MAREHKWDNPPFRTVVEEFRACVDRLDALVVSHRVTRHGRSIASRETDKIGRDLRQLMKDIAAIARLPDMKHVPGIEGLKQIPHATAGPPRLAAFARAMAKKIDAAIAREYRRKKFPPGFKAQLIKKARAMLASDKLAVEAGNRRAAMTADIRRLMSQASGLRNAIGAMLSGRMESDSSLALHWRTVTRLGAKRGRPRKRG
jgi:hypothetical protein